MDNLDTANEVECDCLLCGQSLCTDLALSLGPLVACNRFEKHMPAYGQTHPLAIAECEACGLVQLSMYPPVEFVRPRVSWIRYNEPATHLDMVVGGVQAMLPPEAASVMGVGPFDGPLLDRLAARGLSRIDLDLSSSLPDAQDSYPYLESIQALLRPDVLADLATGQGTADLVTCRYLLEHSHDPVASLQGLRYLAKTDGLVLVEVPDCSKFLAAMDYSFIWEEHLCYFTEETFRACAIRAGYEIASFSRYPGVLEDALVLVLRSSAKKKDNNVAILAGRKSESFLHYRTQFASIRKQYHDALERIVAGGRKVAVFGAGHQSIMFINALGLQRYIDCVIDDAPEKVGYLVPGSEIRIVPSSQLMDDRAIDVCLLGVGPAAVEKIRAKCAAYLNRGGRMYSIFPGAGSGTLIDLS